MSAARKAMTAVQRRRLGEIPQASGQRVYAAPESGRSIVDQFRRYLTQEDLGVSAERCTGFL
jgi:hypothetical protein